MANPSTGALSSLGMAPESAQGTYVSPTKWVFPETVGITAKPDIVKKAVLSGARAANRISRPTKFKVGGPIALPLFTDHGLGFLKPTFGAVTGLAALPADTVKSATPITTANGISTITLTNTTPSTYTLYAWIKVGTGTSSELRQILTISGNGVAGTIVTTGALVKNAAAAAGTAVTQVDQLQYTTATTSPTIPSYSLTLNESTAYAWKLAGCLTNTADFKFTKDETSVTYTPVVTTMPVKAAAVSPSPSAAELADLEHPFTSTDSQFVIVQDPAQAGGSTAASAQLMATTVETADISWKNNLIEKPFHDQSQIYRAFPGIQDLTVKYQYVNQSGRLAEFEDYLSSLANTTVPFVAGAANDQSGAGTGWRAWGMAVPDLALQDVSPARQTGDVLTASVDGQAVLATTSGDLCQVFVVSNAGSTTTGL